MKLKIHILLINFVINISILLFCTNTYADVPSVALRKCNIETKSNELLKGWIISGSYFSGHGTYCYDEILTSEDVEYIRDLELFDNFYNLNYDNSYSHRTKLTDTNIPKQYFAVLEATKKIITKDRIKKIRCYKCINTNSPASILELKEFELNLLTKPAYSTFHHYAERPCVIQLMSYNNNYKTERDLEQLLIKLVKSKIDDHSDMDLKGLHEALDSICFEEQKLEEIKNQLPKQIFMSFYWVHD